MQQPSASASLQYASGSAAQQVSAVSRQASGIVREQSSAGEVVRAAAANYAYLQPTATSSYQTTSYAAQPNVYPPYNSYANQPATSITSYNTGAIAAAGAGSYATQALTGASYGVTGQGSASSVTYGGAHAGDYTSASRMMTGGERVTSTRKVSSTIIDEQFLGPAPQDLPTREVVVDGPIQDVVKYSKKKEIVETEKRVPRYEYEWVEKIVEVPRIEYVDRTVEVPQYQDVVREVKKTEYRDRPVEVIREVKIPRVNYIEKIKEIPGQIIEVPKPYIVEQKTEVLRYTDTKHPVVVAQTIKPYIVEGSGVYEVDVYEYEPQCIPVDVHVLKAVQAQLNGQMVESNHRVVTVPVAQYNTMLQQLNPNLSSIELQKLYKSENGQVSFLGERVTYIEPQANTYIEGFDQSTSVQTHTVRGQTITTQQQVTTTTTGANYGQSGQTSYQVATEYHTAGLGAGYQASGAGYQASGAGYQAIGAGDQASGAVYQASNASYQPASSGYQAEYTTGSYGTGGRTQYSTMSTGGVRPIGSSSLKYQGAVVSS